MRLHIVAEYLEAARAAHEKYDHEQLEAHIEKDVDKACQNFRSKQLDKLVALAVENLALVRLLSFQDAVPLHPNHEQNDTIKWKTDHMHPECVPKAD